MIYYDTLLTQPKRALVLALRYWILLALVTPMGKVGAVTNPTAKVKYHHRRKYCDRDMYQAFVYNDSYLATE